MVHADRDQGSISTLPLAGEIVSYNFDGWGEDILEEFQRHSHDGAVGSRLLSQNERTRIWEIRLQPGERWHFHRHVLDYFWTAITGGRGRQHTHDGTIRESVYSSGETRYFHFAKGEFLLHDLENVGTEQLIFITVEHLDSDNQSIDLEPRQSALNR